MAGRKSVHVLLLPLHPLAYARYGQRLFLAQWNEKEHSSRAGRIYARTGGVSEAVKKTVEQIDPDKKIPVIPEQADGVPACKKLIERIQKGETEANFFEGMACNGGCVGGPKIIIKKEEGKERVDAYGDEAQYRTPLENPFVLELLERLGQGNGPLEHMVW